MSQDYPTRLYWPQLKGYLSGPIRTGHHQRTLTYNTRQPELNSRVSRVHPPSRAQLEGYHFELNSRNATCLTPIPSSTQGICFEPQLKGYILSHNSRNTNKPTFKISAKPCRPRTSKASQTPLPQQHRLALLTSR